MKSMNLALAAALTLATPRHPQEVSMTPSFIDTPQGRLAFYEQGKGAGLPVLFLHADSGIAGQWAEVLPAIAADRRVIALDSRGSGASAKAADGDYSYEGRARDIDAVAEAKNLARFVIVAHSGSGAAALAYAAQNPERVAGLFLLDPATDPRAIPKEIRDGIVAGLEGPQSLDFQKQFYATIAGNDEGVRTRVLADCAKVLAEARLGFGKAFAQWNPEAALDAWKGPIFILAGEASDTGASLYRLRPRIPYEVVKGTGHWLQLDAPDIVAEAIRRFLARIEPK
jgi:pimeloyl-ACP methyl ester carboxylesterase